MTPENRMRKAACISMTMLLSGCSGFGKYVHDTISWPGSNPNAPRGHSETLARVNGRQYHVQPILPESGDLWPGAPEPLPSLSDVARAPHGLVNSLRDRNSYYGRMATFRDKNLSEGELQNGSSLKMGEEYEIEHGALSIHQANLPSQVQDNASKYLEKKKSGTIVLPNGDGTVTLIAPDGSVRVRKEAASEHHAP